jgi:hypothetical protein
LAAAVTARSSASVVLPTPPFSATSAITCMDACIPRYKYTVQGQGTKGDKGGYLAWGKA